MKVISMRGKLSFLEVMTDIGLFKGDGELIESGFTFYTNTIVDNDNNPLSDGQLEALKMAIDEYSKEKCPDFEVFFE